MRKKVLLTAAMGLLFGVQPMFAHDFKVDGLGFNIISEDEAEVTSLNEKYSGSVVIPQTVTHDGATYRVTRIGTDAFRGSWISRVSLPESLSEISDGGFEECALLREIVFNEGLERIGSRAFQACPSLVSLNLPSADLEISWDAFMDTRLRAVAFNFTEVPGFDMLSLGINELPSVVTFPSGAADTFREWCPELFSDRVELRLFGNDILPVWVYPGIFSEEDGEHYLSAGLFPTDESDVIATVTRGTDITLLYPMMVGLPFSIQVDGVLYHPSWMLIPTEEAFASPTDLFSGAFVVRFEDLCADSEVKILTDSTAVGQIAEEGKRFDYNSANHTLTACGDILICDLSGRRVAEGTGSLSISGLAPGLYMVITPEGSGKILVR